MMMISIIIVILLLIVVVILITDNRIDVHVVIINSWLTGRRKTILYLCSYYLHHSYNSLSM